MSENILDKIKELVSGSAAPAPAPPAEPAPQKPNEPLVTPEAIAKAKEELKAETDAAIKAALEKQALEHQEALKKIVSDATPPPNVPPAPPAEPVEGIDSKRWNEEVAKINAKLKLN